MMKHTTVKELDQGLADAIKWAGAVRMFARAALPPHTFVSRWADGLLAALQAGQFNRAEDKARLIEQALMKQPQALDGLTAAQREVEMILAWLNREEPEA